MTRSDALAVGLVVGQYAGLWLLLRLVRTFGAYTERVREVNEHLASLSAVNVEIHTTNIQITERQALITASLDRLSKEA